MEVTDELKDYSYRKIYDDCFQKKTVHYKIYKVLLLLHSLFKCYICILYFKEGKNVLKYDSKEQSLISFICLVIMSCS